jgi:hypothetical protein
MKRSTLPALPACVLGAGLAFAAAAPAQAPPPAAPAVTLDRTCYAPGDAITQAGHGFTPGAEVLETLSLLPPDGAPNPLAVLSATRVADAAGNFAMQIRAPELARDADRREIAGSASTSPPSGRHEAVDPACPARLRARRRPRVRRRPRRARPPDRRRSARP